MIVIALRKLLRSLRSNPRTLSASMFGLSGAAFIVANLLLVRTLTVEQFALLSLLVSVIYVALVAAPLGIDGLVARRSVAVSQMLLGRVLAVSVVVAAAATLYVWRVYSIDPWAAGLMMASICAGGISGFAAVRFQALHQFSRSLFYLRTPDLALFIAAVCAAIVGSRRMVTPLVILTLVLVIIAVVAWTAVARSISQHELPGRFNWREAGAYLSIQVSASLHMQLERLLTPLLLALNDLTVLAVAMALIGPPFRLLQMTVGYALQPRLRSAQTRSERIRLLVNEALLATGIVVLSSGVLWFATQALVEALLHGKVTVPKSVLLACIVSGVIRVASGFAKACMTALASDRELEYVGALSWFGVAVAVGGAWWCARYGLAGIIYAVAAGWSVRVVTAVYFLGRQLRRA
jgi:hypothetical protein